MTTCTKPDRDSPKLVCGYPMPCPHHSVMIDEADLGAAIPTLVWVQRRPTIALCHAIIGGDPPCILVRAVATFGVNVDVWHAERRLPLIAPMRDLRDAFDELTREGHVALENADYVEACGSTGVTSR